jgi:hypothetical protein
MFSDPQSAANPIPMKPHERCESSDAGRHDWARGPRLLLIWCVPVALLLLSAAVGGPYLNVVWPALLTWMGAACLLNARRCGRLHCYLTGPYFLLLALTSLLHGSGTVTLGSRGWLILSVALIVGGPFLVYVPEWVFGRYRAQATSRHP